MEVINIRKPTGRLYQILPDGNITVFGVPASNSWKFLGLKHVKRSDFIPQKELTRGFLRTFDSCWKNGNPQWTVRDIDHGTVQEWGNTKYHGVASMWISELI